MLDIFPSVQALPDPNDTLLITPVAHGAPEHSQDRAGETEGDCGGNCTGVVGQRELGETFVVAIWAFCWEGHVILYLRQIYLGLSIVIVNAFVISDSG